jgi:hypothetical protein
MFGPWCEHPIEELPPEIFPSGRDPFTVLTDTLDGLVRAGAIAPAARAGAEIAVWSSVHGLASLLVERSLELGPAERAQAFAVLSRMVVLGLGMSPALLGPAALPPLADPRSEKVREKTAGAKRR